jgi:hypothetical protein
MQPMLRTWDSSGASVCVQTPDEQDVRTSAASNQLSQRLCVLSTYDITPAATVTLGGPAKTDVSCSLLCHNSEGESTEILRQAAGRITRKALPLIGMFTFGSRKTQRAASQKCETNDPGAPNKHHKGRRFLLESNLLPAS